ncbi:hypothetical protein BDF19DRAFT_413979 [Syncephalis fuscata]|nr:hypothetical protein BDF19DRAFT_413979 [Syncephalis fuscata]
MLLSQTYLRPSALLLQLHAEVLLHLCHFLSDEELVLFAASCRSLYNLIARQPAYWENQYRKQFVLEDWRERDWLAWFNRQANALYPMEPSYTDNSYDSDLSKSIIELTDSMNDFSINSNTFNTTICSMKSKQNDPSSLDWSNTNWYHAYHRRRLTSNAMITGECRVRVCQLPVGNNVKLEMKGMNAWGSLLREQNGMRMWSARHDIFTNTPGVTTDDIYWQELQVPKSMGELRKIDYMEITNSFVMLWATIELSDAELEKQSYFDHGIHWMDNREDNMNSAPLNISATEPVRLRKAIVSWSNMDEKKEFIPIFVQTSEEARAKRTLPNSLGMYDDWLLVQQPCLNVLEEKASDEDDEEEEQREDEEEEDILAKKRRYNIYDMQRRQWVKGPVNIKSRSTAHIQAVTEGTSDILIYHWRKNMQPLGDYEESDDIFLDNMTFEWELNRVTAGQSAYETIHQGSVLVPLWPNPSLDAQEYSPGFSLVSIFDPNDSEIHTGGDLPHSLLALVDVRHSSTKSEYIRPVWTRFVGTTLITPLCSERIVLVQQYMIFDVLDATNGDLLRQIPCEAYSLFWTVLGSMCVLFGMDGNINYFMDMSTGNIHRPMNVWEKNVFTVTEASNEEQVTTNENTEAANTITPTNEDENENTEDTEDANTTPANEDENEDTEDTEDTNTTPANEDENENENESDNENENENTEVTNTNTNSTSDNKLPNYRISCANVGMVSPSGGGKYALFNLTYL